MSPGLGEFLASAKGWEEQRTLATLTERTLFPTFLEFLTHGDALLVHPPSIRPSPVDAPALPADAPVPFTPQDALRCYLTLAQLRLLPPKHPQAHAHAETLYTQFLSVHASPRFVPASPEVVGEIKRAVNDGHVPGLLFTPLYEQLDAYFGRHWLPRFLKTEGYWQVCQEHGRPSLGPVGVERVRAVLEMMPRSVMAGEDVQARSPPVFMRVDRQGNVRRPRRAGGLLSSSHRLTPLVLPEDEDHPPTPVPVETHPPHEEESSPEDGEDALSTQGEGGATSHEDDSRPHLVDLSSPPTDPAPTHPHMSLSQKVEQLLAEDANQEGEREKGESSLSTGKAEEAEEGDDDEEESTEEGETTLEEKRRRESTRFLQEDGSASSSRSREAVDALFTSHQQLLSSNDTVKQETQRLTLLKEKLRRLEADIQQQKMRRLSSPHTVASPPE